MNTQTLVTARSLVAMAERNPMGFTIDAQGNDVSGNYFVVGVKQTLNSHNLEGAEHCIQVYNELMERDTKATLDWEKLDMKLAFGGWLDSDKVYHFDVVMLLEKDDDFDKKWSLKSALVLGMAHSQKSIFDLEHMLEVEVPRVTSYSVL
jgi:hypothetical protein